MKKMGRVGFEHAQVKQSKIPISEKGGAKSDARNAPSATQILQYPDLTLVCKSWSDLTGHIRRAIKELVMGE